MDHCRRQKNYIQYFSAFLLEFEGFVAVVVEKIQTGNTGRDSRLTLNKFLQHQGRKRRTLQLYIIRHNHSAASHTQCSSTKYFISSRINGNFQSPVHSNHKNPTAMKTDSQKRISPLGSANVLLFGWYSVNSIHHLISAC